MNFPAELKYSKLTAQMVPLTGEMMSETALTDSTSPKLSPAVTASEELLDAAAYEAHCAEEG